jgi:hypothetical protein
MTFSLFAAADDSPEGAGDGKGGGEDGERFLHEFPWMMTGAGACIPGMSGRAPLIFARNLQKILNGCRLPGDGFGHKLNATAISSKKLFENVL